MKNKNTVIFLAYEKFQSNNNNLLKISYSLLLQIDTDIENIFR